MNINAIMIREIMEAEKEASKHPPRAKRRRVLPWLAAILWLSTVVAAFGLVFFAGARWQSARDLKAEKDFLKWCDRVELDAAKEARGMTNFQLIDATTNSCISR